MTYNDLQTKLPLLSQYCLICLKKKTTQNTTNGKGCKGLFGQKSQYCDNTLDSRRRRMTSINTGYNSVTGKNAIAIIYFQVSQVT